MYPRLDIHPAEADRLREALLKRDRCTVVVYGESGVGKTTLIEQLLKSLGLAAHSLRYEAVGDGCSLKVYLNSLFSRYYADAGFVRKLYSTRVRLRSAKLSAVVPTSLSFKRSRSGITVSLGGWPDKVRLVFESA